MAILVSNAAIASKIFPWKHGEIGLLEPLMAAPDGSCHAGPWLFNAKQTGLVIPLNGLAILVNDNGVHARQGCCCKSGLGGGYAR